MRGLFEQLKELTASGQSAEATEVRSPPLGTPPRRWVSNKRGGLGRVSDIFVSRDVSRTRLDVY